MLTIKRYKRPFASITIGGERIRITPGVISKFITPISDAKINIHALSTGENSFSIYIDEKDFEKVAKIATKISDNYDITMKKNLGAVSIQGPEILTVPGLLYSLIETIAKNKINIEGITNSHDSDVLFFDFKKTKRAYELISKTIEKNPIFKRRK